MHCTPCHESKSGGLRVHMMEVLRKVGRQPSLPIPIGGVVYSLAAWIGELNLNNLNYIKGI